MKILHKFQINKEIEVDDVILSKDEQGNEVKTIKKIKQNAPQDFFVARPTRTLRSDSSLFYGKKLHEALKQGLLSQKLLAKRLDDDGGLFSEKEKEFGKELRGKLAQKAEEYTKLTTSEKTPEIEEQTKTVLAELAALQKQAQTFEIVELRAYNESAENWALRQSILWWTVHLSYKGTPEKPEPVFPGTSFDQRILKYDEMEESDDPFTAKVLEKLLLIVSFWTYGKAESEDEFKEVERLYAENQKPAN